MELVYFLPVGSSPGGNQAPQQLYQLLLRLVARCGSGSSVILFISRRKVMARH